MGRILGSALRPRAGPGRKQGRPLRPALTGVAYVGASGWSYASWRPGFYPAGSRPEEFLRLYAEQFPSVELNTTGYRLPAEQQFERWAEQVPDGFTFAVKAPPQLERRLDPFQERVRALRDRLGPIRIVLDSPRDQGWLDLLLGSVDPELRLAFDLRDPSWDGVEGRLGAAGAVRVGAWEAAPSFRYLRFRDPPYGEDDLKSLAARLDRLLRAEVDVYAYFRHEDEPTAPRAVRRLLELMGSQP